MTRDKEVFIYNIPATLLGSFPTQGLVIRSSSTRELAESARLIQTERLAWVQLLSVEDDPSPLLGLGKPVPIEIVLGTVDKEVASLYRFSDLLSEQPVRVVVPSVKGAKRATNVAVSLGFAVKLDVQQPEEEALTELIEIADLYLHNPTISQPIEFFHSLLAAMCRKADITLWQIQEEDPTLYRYVSDDGQITLSGRLSSSDLQVDGPNWPQSLKSQLQAKADECAVCGFFKNCAGYFRFPDPNYQCDGVRRLMGILKDAASDIEADLKASGQFPDQHTSEIDS
jgi:hypothetical protein